VNNWGLLELMRQRFFLLGILWVLLCGCQMPPGPAFEVSKSGAGFSPTSIRIGGLTQLLKDPNTQKVKTVRIFVEMRDRFDSKLKTPFTLRLELYRYVPYSSNPQGTHLKTWPDFVLTEAAVNNLYWRDYLRAYEFLLEVEGDLPADSPLLIAATCWTPDGNRLETSSVLPSD
jgi:hypothetical protein